MLQYLQVYNCTIAIMHYFVESNFFPVSPLDGVDITPLVINSSFGDSVSFNCSSRGGPDNTYQWINAETGAIVHNGSMLVIESVSFDNSGEYVCVASNEAGSGSNSSTLNSKHDNAICPFFHQLNCQLMKKSMMEMNGMTI